MKICFIVEYYPPHIGGGEVLFGTLSRGLAEKGHECRVVTCRPPGAPVHENMDGVKVRRIRVPLLPDRAWFTLLCLGQAAKAVKKSDVVHTTTYFGGLAAWLVTRFLHRPVVLTAHEVLGDKWFEIGLPRWKAFFCRLAESLVLALPFDRYSCNSKSTMIALKKKGIPAGKLFLSYHGVNYEAFNPDSDAIEDREKTRKKIGASKKDFLYLYWGRPGITKGVEHLVEAARFVKQEIPDSRLVLVLSEKPFDGYMKIKAMVQRLPADSVTLMETLPLRELVDVIAACDCVVIPSTSEGFGFCCAEACAMGKPVAAARAGALPESVSGKHVLVSPGNPGALARGIMDIHKGRWSVSPKKMFLARKTVEEHIRVYADLLKKEF